MDSRVYGPSPAASTLVDSRLRGNDDSRVIPAEAGIHTALTEDERAVAGTGIEIPCVAAGAGSLTVERLRGNDDSRVIPAEAGIHTALTEDERVVAGTGVEIPCVAAGAGSLTVERLRGNDDSSVNPVIPGDLGPHGSGGSPRILWNRGA